MTEVGLPHVDAKLWYAFLAPSKTPADRITRLYNAFAEIYPVHAVLLASAVSAIGLCTPRRQVFVLLLSRSGRPLVSGCAIFVALEGPGANYVAAV